MRMNLNTDCAGFIFWLLILSCWPFTVACQLPDRPYEQLKWQGLEPLWYVTLVDSLDINEFTDGHASYFETRTSPIVSENSVYIVHQKAKQDFDGIEIERRDVRSGDLIWKHVFDLEDTGFQEVARRLDLHKNKLHVISQIRDPAFGMLIPFAVAEDSTVTLSRVIDVDSGAILKEFSSSFEDSSPLYTPYYFSASGRRVNYFFSRESRDILYVEQLAQDSTLIFGELIESGTPFSKIDTLYRETHIPFIVDRNAEGFLTIQSQENGLFAYLYNSSFSEVIDSFLLPGLEDVYYDIKYYDSQYLVMVNSTGGSSRYLIYKDFRLVEVIEETSITSASFCGNERGLYVFVTHLDSLNQCYLDYFKYDQSLVQLGQLNFEDYRGLILLDCIQSPTEILLVASENARSRNSMDDYVLDFRAKALSLIAFETSTLERTVILNDYVPDREVLIFPNPSQNYVTLEGLDADKRCFIIDSEGSKVMDIRVLGTRTKLWIGGLRSGTYYVVQELDVVGSLVKI